MDILKIKRVQYLDGYRVKLWFSNGDIKIANLSESFDGPIFEPLKNLSYFKNFTIRYNTIQLNGRMARTMRRNIYTKSANQHNSLSTASAIPVLFLYPHPQPPQVPVLHEIPLFVYYRSRKSIKLN